MVKPSPKLKRLYREFENDERRGNCQKTAIFGAVFMMFGMSLDKVVYPEMLWDFFYNRLTVSLIMVVLGLAVVSIKNALIVRVVTHAVVLLPFISICHMILSVDGAASPYYAGLNLVLMGAALIVKWGLKDGAVNAALSMAIFGYTLFLHGSSWNDSFIPLYFVFVTSAMVSMGTYMYGARRFNEFCLIKEVEDANARLEGSNQQLKAMDETKSRFFANISHELRTPLTLILGPTESLLSNPQYTSDEELKNQLGFIEGNALRLLRLINDILDLVKLDSGESAARPEGLAVGQFVADLTSNLDSIASLKGITLSCRNDVPEGEVVYLDRDRLEKIILNLAMNAIKFTPPEGNVELGVRIRNASDEIEFTVQDTGEGLSEEDVNNVFVRFWQADMSAKRKHRGAGIGLALVKSLTDSMAGVIGVESELGKGTTFKVAFPVGKSRGEDLGLESPPVDVLENFNIRARWEGVTVDAPQTVPSDFQALPTAKTSSGSTDVDEGTRKTVLVADDEELMRQFIARQLRGRYDVIEAMDGQDAWGKIQKHRPDILVLDMMMPHLDGIELTSMVRADEDVGRTPIVLVTAQASEKPRLEALAKGVNDFITKPFSTVELQSRIGNLLRGSEFERRLSDSHVQLGEAFEQLKDQEAILVQTEKLSSLGRMSAGIVHEVNNPLNYTKTALYALTSFDQQLPEEEREDFLDVLGDAKEGVERVIGIVSDLRAFTRGDTTLHGQMNILDAIESARRLSSDSLSGISFELEAEGEFVIDGNEGQLCQLFINFFQNASRAIRVTEREGGVVRVIVKAYEGGTMVRVRDNGCGIEEEDRDKIFEPFFTKNDVGEGMGLGLSICSKIIEQHEATVEVDSVLGEFTEIIVKFPNQVGNSF